VVLFECETWSLTLGEECKLRVFKNVVLRGIFGREGGENCITWSCMICFFSPSIIRIIKSWRMRWAGILRYFISCGTNGEEDDRV
jgi:hypothetical protein